MVVLQNSMFIEELCRIVAGSFGQKGYLLSRFDARTTAMRSSLTPSATTYSFAMFTEPGNCYAYSLNSGEFEDWEEQEA